VGRSGDQCKRIRFQDVEMVDHQQELQQTAKLFEYISKLQNTIQITKATARVAATGAPKQVAVAKHKYSTIASR
jgi:hypothetical protein